MTKTEMVEKWMNLAHRHGIDLEKLKPIPSKLLEDSMSALAAAFGLNRMPLSYETYFEVFGIGAWWNHFRILPPPSKNHPVNIYDYNQDVIVGMPDPSLSDAYLIMGTIPVDDLYICWKRDAVIGDQDEELAITLLDVDFGETYGLAESLFEVVAKWWVAGGINDVYPLPDNDTWETSAIFEPYV